MTAEAWEATDHFGTLYAWLAASGRLTERKARLLGCAACRLLPWGLTWRVNRCLDAAEAAADGRATPAQVKAARRGALKEAARHRAYRSLYAGGGADPARAAASAAGNPYESGVRAACEAVIRSLGGDRADPGRGTRAVVALVRDVFGNPYAPARLDPRWRTADVLGLARAVYEDRAFDRLPLLADALMDAGCDSADVLAHCRSDGPHVRGCWVVDLLLGKE